MLSALISKLGPTKASGREQRFNCPFCVSAGKSPDTKFHLYVNLQKGVANCFRCETKLSVTRLLGDLSEYRELAKQSQVDVGKLPVALPDVVFGGSANFSRLRKHVEPEVRYALSRGLNQRNLKYFGFSPDSVYVFNAPYGNGIFHYYQRDVTCKRFSMPSGIQKPLYYMDLAVHKRVVVLAEGPFDAFPWWSDSRIGINLCGKTMSDYQYAQLQSILAEGKVTEVVVALDSDANSKALLVRLSELRSRKLVVSFVHLPNGRDSDELTKNELQNCFAEREIWGLRSYIHLSWDKR